MAADIHAVAVVLHGARDTAEFAGPLQHGHVVLVGTAVLDEFPCGGKSSRTAADNYNVMLNHGYASSPFIISEPLRFLQISVIGIPVSRERISIALGVQKPA